MGTKAHRYRLKLRWFPTEVCLMRKTARTLAMLLLMLSISITTGCFPRWMTEASKYSRSNVLYSQDDPPSALMIAPDEQSFIIIGVKLSHTGSQPKDIRDGLLFALYDCYGDDIRYNNFYKSSGAPLFDAIGYMTQKGQWLEGSVFFMVPEGFTEQDAVFVVMTPAYEVIYAVDLGTLVRVEDYPGSW